MQRLPTLMFVLHVESIRVRRARALLCLAPPQDLLRGTGC